MAQEDAGTCDKRGTARMELQKIDERAKLQFDYAWKWFESHQKQRMVMFYYYCIIVGILANALVTSYKESYSTIRVPIGIMSIVTSLAFFFLDIRNRSMATAGENVLEKLENELIFPLDFVDKDGNKMGPLSVDRRMGMREDQKQTFRAKLLKHKWWIRGMQLIVALYFLVIVVKAVAN